MHTCQVMHLYGDKHCLDIQSHAHMQVMRLWRQTLLTVLTFEVDGTEYRHIIHDSMW